MAVGIQTVQVRDQRLNLSYLGRCHQDVNKMAADVTEVGNERRGQGYRAEQRIGRPEELDDPA